MIETFEVKDWSDRGPEIDDFVEANLASGEAYIQIGVDYEDHEDYYMIDTANKTSTRLPLDLIVRLIEEGKIAPRTVN